MTEHTRHVEVVVWSMDCIEGECDHIDAQTEPFDLSNCPSRPMEACVDCMVERGYPADADWWEGVFDPWPHRAPMPALVPHGPDPEPPLFKNRIPVDSQSGDTIRP